MLLRSALPVRTPGRAVLLAVLLLVSIPGRSVAGDSPRQPTSSFIKYLYNPGGGLYAVEVQRQDILAVRGDFFVADVTLVSRSDYKNREEMHALRGVYHIPESGDYQLALLIPATNRGWQCPPWNPPIPPKPPCNCYSGWRISISYVLAGQSESISTLPSLCEEAPTQVTTMTLLDPDGQSVPEITPQAPTTVQIAGPSTGLVGQSYVFTAASAPLTVTLPMTYTWQATGAPDLVHSAGLSDTATFSWTIPGPQTITVTVANLAGFAHDTHIVTIQDSGTPQSTLLLPALRR